MALCGVCVPIVQPLPPGGIVVGTRPALNVGDGLGVGLPIHRHVEFATGCVFPAGTFDFAGVAVASGREYTKVEELARWHRDALDLRISTGGDGGVEDVLARAPVARPDFDTGDVELDAVEVRLVDEEETGRGFTTAGDCKPERGANESMFASPSAGDTVCVVHEVVDRRHHPYVSATGHSIPLGQSIFLCGCSRINPVSRCPARGLGR